MTAGGGILHIEKPPECARRQRRPVPRPPAVGEPAQGAEVGRAALPGPARRASRCCWPSPDAGAFLRVIAGDVAGHAGPGLHLHADGDGARHLAPGATLDLPWRPDFNALVYVLAGAGSVGVDGQPVRTGQLAVFGPGDTITINGAPAAGVAAPRRSTSSSSAASRSASRSRCTGRS